MAFVDLLIIHSSRPSLIHYLDLTNVYYYDKVYRNILIQSLLEAIKSDSQSLSVLFFLLKVVDLVLNLISIHERRSYVMSQKVICCNLFFLFLMLFNVI